MKRTTDFVLKNIGGEKLLVPIGPRVKEMNGLVTLNNTASCVWELLAKECSLDEIVDVVTERFDIAPECARRDIQNFLIVLTKMGLIEL